MHVVFVLLASVAAQVSRVNVVIAVGAKKTGGRSHLTEVNKQVTAELEGCTDRVQRMTLRVNNERQALGSTTLQGRTRSSCTLNIFVGIQSGRRHPATIALCRGGSCSGEGTCHKPCSGGNCGAGVDHESDGVCNDDQSQSSLCSGIGECGECDGGEIHIACTWLEYESTCISSCEAVAPPVVSSSSSYIWYFVLIPLVLVVLLVGVFFLIRYLRKPRKAIRRRRGTGNSPFGFLARFVRKKSVAQSAHGEETPTKKLPILATPQTPTKKLPIPTTPKTPANFTPTMPERKHAGGSSPNNKVRNGKLPSSLSPNFRGSHNRRSPGASALNSPTGNASARGSPKPANRPNSKTPTGSRPSPSERGMPSFPPWNDVQE